MKKIIVVIMLIMVSIMLCGCMKEEMPPQLTLSDPSEKYLHEKILYEDIITEEIDIETWDSVAVQSWD